MAKSKPGKRSKKLMTKRRSVKDLSASKAQGVKGGFMSTQQINIKA